MFRGESSMLQHLRCPSCLNYILESSDKSLYSIKGGSGTGMGTAGSNELFQSTLARISLYCHVTLSHLQNKHLQSYICFVRFVHWGWGVCRILEIRIPGIEVIVHEQEAFLEMQSGIRYCDINQTEGCSIPE